MQMFFLHKERRMPSYDLCDISGWIGDGNNSL